VKNASPFLDLDEDRPHVPVWFNGNELSLPEGANLAAALLATGVGRFRQTPVSGAPRAPYCMMGACFDCLIEIGGVTRQACMLEVSEGMRLSFPALPAEDTDANE